MGLFFVGIQPGMAYVSICLPCEGLWNLIQYDDVI